MRRHPSVIIAAVALAALGVVLVLARSSVHRLHVKCYFQNAQGLRPGAVVRMAGVNVGVVASVRVRPELREQPAEVQMLLNTPYELKIPDDAVVSLETAGALGEVFPQIDIKQASGPPLADWGVLKTRPGASPTPQQWLECFSNVMEHKPCDLHGKAEGTNQGPPAAPGPR